MYSYDRACDDLKDAVTGSPLASRLHDNNNNGNGNGGGGGTNDTVIKLSNESSAKLDDTRDTAATVVVVETTDKVMTIDAAAEGDKENRRRGHLLGRIYRRMRKCSMGWSKTGHRRGD